MIINAFCTDRGLFLFSKYSEMEETEATIRPELLSLTYGAFISQIVKDYEDVNEINKQIDQLGYLISFH